MQLVHRPCDRRPTSRRAADGDRQPQPGQSAELYTGAAALYTLSPADAMSNEHKLEMLRPD